MNRIVLYHGSEKIIEIPSNGGGGLYNDYGRGFYTTANKEMAMEWANRKIKNGFVNKYSFDGRGLKIFDLTKLGALKWIAVLMHNRDIDPQTKELYRMRFDFLEEHYYPKEIEECDVVVGYRADDAYFKFPMYFIRGELSLERLEEIYRLGHLGTQIALMSKKAFERIKFISYEEVESIYYDRYRSRKNSVDKRFEEIRIEEINNTNTTKIDDLMKRYGEH